MPFSRTRFTSAPLSDTNASILRQPPGPEVDAEWERLSDMGTHIISSKDVRKLGKNPSGAVRFPVEWGHGPDSYMATLDGIHLMHCLNSMRQNLWINFDYYHEKPLGPEYVPHLTHCVEAIAEHLMCKPSFEMITHNWIDRPTASSFTDLPFPDFAINKMCWDYEAILQWKDEHRYRDIEEKFEQIKPPKSIVRLPMPPLVREAWDELEKRRKTTD